MKKALLIIFTLIAIIVIGMMSFGIKIGSVRVGSQNDLVGLKEDHEITNSPFYKTYLSSDKLVCLNLWATWCVPCVEEMPMLNEVRAANAGRNIEFVALSVDNDTVKLNRFLATGKIEFDEITMDNLRYRTAILNFLEGKDPANRINSHTVPVTYLIRNGKVTDKLTGMLNRTEFEEALKNTLN